MPANRSTQKRAETRLKNSLYPKNARKNYRIILKDKRGKKAPFYQAISFEIYYGKRKITPNTLFSSRQKNALNKKNFLIRLINAIESIRLIRLEEANEKRRLKKLQEKRKREEWARREFENLNKYERRSLRLIRFAETETLEFSKARFVKPKTLKQMDQEVMSIPVISKRSGYYPHFYYKVLNSPTFGPIQLSIFKFMLKKRIEMKNSNFNLALTDIRSRFTPHLLRFYNDVKKSHRDFILRIKFQFDDKREMAVSGIRLRVTNDVQMAGLLLATIYRIRGDEVKPLRILKIDPTDYLQGNNKIFITGFTIEAM